MAGLKQIEFDENRPLLEPGCLWASLRVICKAGCFESNVLTGWLGPLLSLNSKFSYLESVTTGEKKDTNMGSFLLFERMTSKKQNFPFSRHPDFGTTSLFLFSLPSLEFYIREGSFTPTSPKGQDPLLFSHSPYVVNCPPYSHIPSCSCLSLLLAF